MHRRRDEIIVQLAGHLADSRAREATLAARLAWYQATVAEMAPDAPGLTLVPPQALRRSSEACTRSG